MMPHVKVKVARFGPSLLQANLSRVIKVILILGQSKRLKDNSKRMKEKLNKIGESVLTSMSRINGSKSKLVRNKKQTEDRQNTKGSNNSNNNNNSSSSSGNKPSMSKPNGDNNNNNQMMSIKDGGKLRKLPMLKLRNNGRGIKNNMQKSRRKRKKRHKQDMKKG